MAWSEAVTANSVTDYQVEFAIFKPAAENGSGVEGTGALVSQSVFAVADAQNVKVADYSSGGASFEFLAYGDASSTTIVEFDQSGHQLASITDASPDGTPFSDIAVLAAGLIAVTYGAGTTAYTTDIYDFRQGGLSIDDSTGSFTSNQYFAGTEHSDTITGASGVDNFYSYVGADTALYPALTAPTDSFDGGATGSWSEVVFADAVSDYSIAANGGSSFTITYIDAAGLHSGSLTVDNNVQALAFDPSQDPSPAGNIAEIATGETLVGLDSFSSSAAMPAADQIVTFDGGTGSLVLYNPESFIGHIAGFTGTAPDAAHSDTIDLVGIDYNAAGFSESYTPGTGLLTVTDGANSANFTFDNFTGALDFASDGNGGTLITDPPATGTAAPSVVSTAVSTATTDSASGDISFATPHGGDTFTDSVTPDGTNYGGSFSLDQPVETNGHVSVGFDFMADNDQINLTPGETLTQSYSVNIADAQNPAENISQTVSVTVGGPGNDSFVFAPGVGADTIVNFNPQHDVLELDHFASAQTVQELQSLIGTDAHGDAVIDLGNHDSVTLAGVTTTQLQEAIQASHVLLH